MGGVALVNLNREKVLHDIYGEGIIVSPISDAGTFMVQFEFKTLEFKYPNVFDGEMILLNDRKSDLITNDVEKYRLENINQPTMQNKKIDEIKALLTSENIKQIVKEYLVNSFDKKLVEEALNSILIKVQSLLTSTVMGGEFDYYEEPADIEYMIIKTSEDRVKFCGGSLYEATRFAWNLNVNRANQYEYVFSVIKGVVQRVYKVAFWKKVLEGESAGRYEFYGEEAERAIQDRFVGKRIPPYYSKKGLASPVLYKRIKIYI